MRALLLIPDDAVSSVRSLPGLGIERTEAGTYVRLPSGDATRVPPRFPVRVLHIVLSDSEADRLMGCPRWGIQVLVNRAAVSGDQVVVRSHRFESGFLNLDVRPSASVLLPLETPRRALEDVAHCLQCSGDRPPGERCFPILDGSCSG